LIKAGFIVQGAAKVKTPVDLGNLRASSFVIWQTGQDIPMSPANTGEKEKQMTPDQMVAYAQGCALAAEEARRMQMDASMKNRFVVVIGFSAYYAIFVHENMESYHAVGESKFLERALQEKEQTILTMLKNAVAANIEKTKHK
jgi:hypothetical protein